MELVSHPGMTLSARAVTFSVVLLLGCGGDEVKPPDGPPVRELSTPLLRSIAPTLIRAGDELTIFGADFADDQIGEPQLTFEGVYQTTAGKTIQVTLDVVPKWKNQGTLTWEFGPNVPFGADDTGSFRGVIKARNVGRDGQIKEAEQALGVEMQVLPSILISQLRPVSQGCSTAARETTDNTKLVMEVKAIGLKAGSSIAPLRFMYTFMKESFQFNGYFSNKLGVDPESLFPNKTGPVSVIDEVKNGTASSLGTGTPHSLYVFQGANTANLASVALGTDNLFSLTDLITSPLPDAQASRAATLNIVAVDSMGHEARRTVNFTVWAPVEVNYDGSSEVVRTYDPIPVSACIPGGDIGRDVTYAESTSETRQRSVLIHTKVGVAVEPSAFGVKLGHLSAEFGIDVQGQVTSASSKSLSLTGKILPKEFGMLFRQTMQLERRANLVGHGPCGDTQDLGMAIVTDWTWAPDLGKAATCPPPSNLPAGQQFK
jgi:hypothetical protein